MAEQPESLLLEHLRALRRDIDDIKLTLTTEMATKSDLHSLRADVASDMLTMQADMARMQQDTRDQIVGLRRALVEYHSAVVGHGILISELEERVRRLEQHLELPSLERRGERPALRNPHGLAGLRITSAGSSPWTRHSSARPRA